MSNGLFVSGLRAGHERGDDVVRGASFHAHRGHVTALIGPNGAGKTTLLRALVGLIPSRGEATLDGMSLRDLTPPARAKQVAYVPQRTRLTARLSVRAVVELGRFAHLGAWGRPRASDGDAVEQALAQTGALALATRPFVELSGGEQQRVLLARALATGATALLLDEPTGSLDVQYALELHALLRRIADAGAVVVIVLHDLGEVREHADHVVLMERGSVRFSASTSEVVADHPIAEVYRVRLVEGARPGFRLLGAEGGVP